MLRAHRRARSPLRVGLEADEVFRAVQPPETLLIGEPVAEERSGLGQQAGEDLAAKIAGLIARYGFQNRRFKNVNPGVDPVRKDLLRKTASGTA